MVTKKRSKRNPHRVNASALYDMSAECPKIVCTYSDRPRSAP